MRNVFSLAWSALIISLLFPVRIYPQPGLPRQLPPGGETIRTQAAEVLVDVVVSDRKNRLVTDLNRQDFVIYEDGVAQEISSFLIYRGVPESLAPATAAQPAPAEVPSVPVRPSANLMIFLLDHSTTQFENQKLVRDAAIKYVEEKLQPNDLLAVFVLGAGLRFLTDFTSDKSRLLAALRTTDVTASALASERASLSGGIAAGQSVQVQLQGGGGTPAAPSGPGAAGAAAGLGARGAGQGVAMLAQRIAAQYFALRSSLDQRQTRNVLTAIRAIALGVKGIEGRKSLILFSEGFVVAPNLEGELHSVVDLANRSNLAVYCIESQGLTTRELSGALLPQQELESILGTQEERMRSTGGDTVFDRARQVGSDLRESALRYVANSTGGFLIRNTNDLGVGLARVDEEMRSYYLLSYRPMNPNFDGQFRQIRVEVRRPGLSVKARSGYFAVPSGYEFLTPEEFRLVTQARSLSASAAMPLFLRTGSFQDEGRQYRVPVIIEIPATAIQFEKIREVLSARLRIIGVVRDGTGTFVTRFGGPIQLTATKAEYDVLKPGNVSFMNTLRLPGGGSYSFEVTVSDLPSGKVSRRDQGIFLQPIEPRLALSSILLAKEVDKAPSPGTEFLHVQGVKILPSARCEFRNGENLIFYFDIYYPQVGPGNKTDVSVELSLLREGRPVSVRLPRYSLNDFLTDPVPHITLTRYLKLAGLEPGDYSLLVAVKDFLGSQTARAQASFSVVN